MRDDNIEVLEVERVMLWRCKCRVNVSYEDITVPNRSICASNQCNDEDGTLGHSHLLNDTC